MTQTQNPDLYDDIDLDAFDDFDGADIAPARWGGTDYLSGMWSSSFSRHDSQAAVVAHGMVQTFVNAFARDGRYLVTFDPRVSTAGTDMDTRRVVITPAPILDQSIDAEQAGLILTGLAVHEISHSRYGKATAAAVARAFPRNGLADQLSNILDDVRIEARFAADYPGYAGVFAPTLDYVGRGMVAKNGGRPIELAAGDYANIASAAIRYSEYTDWFGLEAERDWWQAWAGRWSREDSPRRHVEAIREALRHVVAARQSAKAERADEQPEQAAADESQEPAPAEADEAGTNEDMDAGEDQESGASDGDADDDEKIDADAAGTDSGASLDDADEATDEGEDADDELGEMSDSDLNEASRESSPRSDIDMPACAGSEAVESAAEDGGVDPYAIESAAEAAQEAVESARDGEDDGHGNQVDVARSLRGLIHGRISHRTSTRIQASEAAARYVRDAILRSRSGHTGTSRYQKRGQLDNRGLHRIAANDARLFSKRHAPDPGRYLVWFLIDCSSSMSGAPIVQAAQVAEAVAAASRSTPNTRVEVWGWSDAFRPNRWGAGAARVWSDGQPVSDVRKVADLPMGGTPDTEIICWAARAITREARGSEQPVLIVGSDGAGNGGNVATQRAVEEARSLGVEVRSVALGHAVTEEVQLQMYGRGGYVAWQGSVLETAKPLARMIAAMVGKARR